MATTPITICGNATSEVELRFTPAGKAVANFNVAVNHRKKGQNGEWEDDGATFYRVSAWGALGEHCAASIQKGMAVIVTGEVRNREYEKRDGGGKGYSLEVTAEDVGPSLRWAEATVTRVQGNQSGGGQGAGWGQQQTRQQAQGADPWAAQPTEAPF